jgi:tRNA 5-methylaminomethyl-2-thiouridine biosynthesis bifunctional protein
MTSDSVSVDWDSSGQPISRRFNDIYFSNGNGLEESRYVFLQHNQLRMRFTTLGDHEHFTIGETGFGTGLNFLACWQHWDNTAPTTARLCYVSVEKYPLHPDELTRALGLWPELKHYADQLIAAYRAHFIGGDKNQWLSINLNNVRLLLLIDDAEKGFQQLLASPHPDFYRPQWCGVDAWFLDGFAPAKNPAMWTQRLFDLIATISNDQATLATYTVAGSVRRGLQAAGFTIEKVPGFDQKREMLIGERSTQTNIQHTRPLIDNSATPWPMIQHYQSHTQPQSVAIIGGGLAACHCAFALAKRGISVSIIEEQTQLAQGASGNPQGVVYAKISAHDQMLSHFNLSSLLFAQAFYRDFWQQEPSQGQACGVLQLTHHPKIASLHQLLAKQFESSALLHYLSPQEASAVAKVALEYPALYFPYSGWINPVALCQWLVQNSAISLVTNTCIKQLQLTEKNQWLVNGYQNGKTVWQQPFDQVIIATANDAKRFEQSQWLPTKAIRGQISYIPTTNPLSALATVICAEGYIAPATTIAQTHAHALGASYNLHTDSTQLSEDDHLSNLEQTARYLPDINLPLSATDGRVGFRCTSPDYLPLIGPLPNRELFRKTYRRLQHNAKQIVPAAGPYWPGLYSSIAHGSRGLAYTPLAAEILACLITGEAPPISQTMAEALNPARFLIRELSRHQ